MDAKSEKFQPFGLNDAVVILTAALAAAAHFVLDDLGSNNGTSVNGVRIESPWLLEDGELARVGETDTTPVDTRFVFASNEPGPDFGLEHDLLARLRVVELPPLCKRPADIPGIFDRVLGDTLERSHRHDDVSSHLEVLHYQALILDGLKKDNVRGLVNIADRIVSRLAVGTAADAAVAEGFRGFNVAEKSTETIPEKAPEALSAPVSPEDQPGGMEALLRELNHEHGGNVSAIERELYKRNIGWGRRKIALWLDNLGLGRIKKPRDDW
jgi:transcriptional regulator with AAA-type ATPase domain